MKCDRCGLQSDVEQAFSTETHLLARPRRYCPDCTVRRHALSFLTEIVILGGAGLLLYALTPRSWIAALYLQGAFIILSLPLFILVHELAHAAAGWLVGLRVFGIMVGIGKTIWHGKFLGIEWFINLLPLGGVTSVGARPVPHIRKKLFLIYLAGPASHLVLAVFCSIALNTMGLPVEVERILRALMFANILLGIVNFLPRKVAGITGMQGTDGWHLLRAPSLTEDDLRKYYVGYYTGEALQAYNAYDFAAAQAWAEKGLALDKSSGIARNVLGVIQMARKEYQEARDTFLRLLNSPEGKQPGLYYILLNNVAYLNALLHDPALLAEADQFSEEAHKHLSWVPAIIGTRGTVLVEMGQLEEGIVLLKKSMSLHAERQGKALNACYLAIGESRRGNLEEARKYLATARLLDRRCFLLPDVEQQLSAYQPAVLSAAAEHA